MMQLFRNQNYSMKFTVGQLASIEAAILKNVRSEPGISRVGLSRKLQIAPSTVGNYTGRLIMEGFLVESEIASFEIGRPPTGLRLNPDGGQFIGVDFEARNIMATLVDFSARPLKNAHRSISESDSVKEIVEKIEQAITEVLPENRSRLLAIGVGVPGLVDPELGVALSYKYISSWRNVPLVEPLAEQFGVPVYLENTVRSMAMAELWFGQGLGMKDFLCLGIRSGIGVGIVAGGQIQHGANHRSGEIGRWLCPGSATPAAKLFAGSGVSPMSEMELQEIASVRAILSALERARQAKEPSLLSAIGTPLTIADVVNAARQRDRLTLQVIEFAAEILGWAVGELTLVLNPSHVILAGPLTLLGEIMLQPLRQSAEKILAGSGGDVPQIVNSTMGEYSGALGAAALAVHEWKPQR
jgi:N-acetylglucosamine repressor